MSLRVLIVDDEAPARARLRQMLQPVPDVEIVAECSNGRQALAAVKDLRPDLVFLDIQMPRMSGIEVGRQLAANPLPLIVFVTAFDQFAIQAFEVHAVDYLLKPFDHDRFARAFNHARDRLRSGPAPDPRPDLLAALERLQHAPPELERLAFKTDGRVVFIRVEELDWIESDGNYAKLHVGSAVHLLRETMATLEGRLPSARFIRISRSTIVNLDRIKEVQPLFYGDQVVILLDGTQLNLSRNYRERFDALLLRPK